MEPSKHPNSEEDSATLNSGKESHICREALRLKCAAERGLPHPSVKSFNQLQQSQLTRSVWPPQLWLTLWDWLLEYVYLL